jgi:uncharacterized membrane protein YfcA
MLRETRDGAEVQARHPHGVRPVAVLAMTGLGVGALTGLVGVGGGFMIVPALVLLAAVPMKRAIGTSLSVISLSTLTGALAYHGQATPAWHVVLFFTALAIVGTVAGTRLARRVAPQRLRRAFGALVLLLAVFLLYQNRTAGSRVRAPAVGHRG